MFPPFFYFNSMHGIHVKFLSLKSYFIKLIWISWFLLFLLYFNLHLLRVMNACLSSYSWCCKWIVYWCWLFLIKRWPLGLHFSGLFSVRAVSFDYRNGHLFGPAYSRNHMWQVILALVSFLNCFL